MLDAMTQMVNHFGTSNIDVYTQDWGTPMRMHGTDTLCIVGTVKVNNEIYDIWFLPTGEITQVIHDA